MILKKEIKRYQLVVPYCDGKNGASCGSRYPSQQAFGK
jgi:hypothetical protein